MDRSVFLSDIDGTLVRGDVLPAPEVVQAADVFRAESMSVYTPFFLY